MCYGSFQLKVETGWRVNFVGGITMENQFARELYNEYKWTADALVNTYCQLKNERPYTEFPRLGQMIWKYHTLMSLHKELSHIWRKGE